MNSGACGKAAQKATLKQSFLTDERYIRASWINVIAMIFHELTAINIIAAYSNTIFENILGDPDQQTSGFTARQGTYVVGAVNFLGSCLSIITLRYLGRRTLLVSGHMGMSICYLLMGVFTITGLNYGVLVMISLFLLIFCNTSGPVAWIYCSETCSDGALGACLMVLYATVTILSLITEPLMNSALQPQGVFFLFSGFNFLGFFFMYFYVPETKGLIEAEKKR